MSPPQAEVTISIVSHGHGSMVDLLLDDLTRFSSDTVEVCLTLNVPEKKFQVPENGVRLRIKQNTHPKGFAANHNAAAQSATTPYFCVLNPDVRLTSNPFPRLVEQLNAHSAGAIAPLIVDSQGRLQDSVRRFPTLGSLVRKALNGSGQLEYPLSRGTGVFQADWVAGMFILFPTAVFRAVGGFDVRYFLYYEDVDLCARLASRGLAVLVDPSVTAIHDPRRSSWREPRYALHHARSMIRYLLRKRTLLGSRTETLAPIASQGDTRDRRYRTVDGP